MKNTETLSLHGIEGLLTYNFFCESLLTALHTVAHVMEDNHMDIPDELEPVIESFAELGASMSRWYEQQELPVTIFKEKFFHLTKCTFILDKAMAPLVKDNQKLFYYYAIFSQGMTLIADAVFERMHYDCEDQQQSAPEIEALYEHYLDFIEKN